MTRLLLLFMLLPFSLCAQSNSMGGKYIKGTVKHKISQEPVKNALIVLSYGNKPLESAITNAFGEFRIGICSCYYDSLLTLQVTQESYLTLQEKFTPSSTEQFDLKLGYDYRNGTSKAQFKELYTRATYTRLAKDIQHERFYINCVGEIKQGKEIKLYSEQNWEETKIGGFGR